MYSHNYDYVNSSHNLDTIQTMTCFCSVVAVWYLSWWCGIPWWQPSPFPVIISEKKQPWTCLSWCCDSLQRQTTKS